MASEDGIRIKKKYGQHFLKDLWVVDEIVSSVKLDDNSSVFEIGGGAGFLTKGILLAKLARLWVFEIDEEWVEHLNKTIEDPRLRVFHQNILDLDFKVFEADKPWTLLANLPYVVTFPILHLLQRNIHLLKEGVIMVQEEVAQKILKSSGKDYGYVSLFFQHYFEWKMLSKIPPAAFNPPPKVFSRLLYFKPNISRVTIPDEEGFWKFIKVCFKQPRRTLRNNLLQSQYDITNFTEDMLKLRAQQMSFNDLLAIWVCLPKK